MLVELTVALSAVACASGTDFDFSLIQMDAAANTTPEAAAQCYGVTGVTVGNNDGENIAGDNIGATDECNCLDKCSAQSGCVGYVYMISISGCWLKQTWGDSIGATGGCSAGDCHSGLLGMVSKVTTPSPTASPTPSPTSSPTSSPTPSPTSSPTASPTPSPTGSPTSSPTASPTAGPTPSPTPAAASPTPSPAMPSATGDPHLQNIHGERFDLMQPGKYVLINVPRGKGADSAMLRVQADAVRLGKNCGDLYFQELNVTGSWAEAKQAGGYHYSVSQSDATTSGWAEFGKVALKIVVARKDSDVQYLNVYAKHLGQAGFAVGGLLGEDDHEEASTPPEACVKRLSLTKGSDTALQTFPFGSVAEASLA